MIFELRKAPLKEGAIGVFDSGVGGLTVLQHLLKDLPNESFIYFGDTARLPYGEKSPEAILRYSMEGANFLYGKNIKMLVVACNTASAYALEKLQESFDIPVVGVIDPGAEHAVQVSLTGHIAVLGTKATIKSQAYQKTILQKNPTARVLPIACPLLVPLVEENYAEHPAAELIIRDYLKSLKEHQIDTILLGCTHYPLLKKLICKEAGEEVSVIDSADACAEKVRNILNAHKLNSTSLSYEHKYYVSDDPQKFQALGRSLLGIPIRDVELI